MIKEISFPIDLDSIKDVETVEAMIEYLKIQKQILKGKVIYSESGILNKIKLLLGYVLITNSKENPK